MAINLIFVTNFSANKHNKADLLYDECRALGVEVDEIPNMDT